MFSMTQQQSVEEEAIRPYVKTVTGIMNHRLSAEWEKQLGVWAMRTRMTKNELCSTLIGKGAVVMFGAQQGITEAIEINMTRLIFKKDSIKPKKCDSTAERLGSFIEGTRGGRLSSLRIQKDHWRLIRYLADDMGIKISEALFYLLQCGFTLFLKFMAETKSQTFASLWNHTLLRIDFDSKPIIPYFRREDEYQEVGIK